MSAEACLDRALPRVHAIHHTNIDAPLLGEDASLDERADWICDVLYLPDALYCIALAVVMLAGPGPWSLDALIAARLAT